MCSVKRNKPKRKSSPDCPSADRPIPEQDLYHCWMCGRHLRDRECEICGPCRRRFRMPLGGFGA